MTELWQRGAGELAGMIARQEVSSAEVVEAHLARIETVNPQVNAITSVLAEQARTEAVEADRAVAAGARLGRLHGVPITVKQNIDQVGSATNHGLLALAGAIAEVDAPVVERMRAAGAIPVGRTNCPDMALRVHTDSALFGLTRNPWNLGHTVGGSSGGEGAALATGMSPLGLGNDIGGSLRNPASCCGIASIKPSHGVVPQASTIPSTDGPASFQLMPVEGPMARTVADVRLGLEVLVGRHRRDPYSLPVAPPAPRPEDRPLRVGVLTDPPGGSTDPRVSARVRAAADALAAAGYDVVDGDPPRYAEAAELWLEFLGADLHTMHPLLAPLLSADANLFLDNVMAAHPPIDLGAYTQVLMTRQALMREWSQWFAATDLLLTPAWTQLPFQHGYDISSPQASLDTIELIRCVTHANLLGLPSACVSAGLADGLPVGVLLNADRFRDDLALDAAEVIEQALGTLTPIDPK
ncbi:MAG: amidase [Ilumatobacteraceae bacterium]